MYGAYQCKEQTFLAPHTPKFTKMSILEKILNNRNIVKQIIVSMSQNLRTLWDIEQLFLSLTEKSIDQETND